MPALTAAVSPNCLLSLKAFEYRVESGVKKSGVFRSTTPVSNWSDGPAHCATVAKVVVGAWFWYLPMANS